MAINFNLYDTKVEDNQSLAMYSYQTGNFLTVFSGLLISNTSASTLRDYFIDKEYTYDQFEFDLYINNNSYLTSGSDTSYSIIVSDFYLSSILSSYSGSTLSAMLGETLTELSVSYIG